MVGSDARLHGEHRCGVEVHARQFRHALEVLHILLSQGSVPLLAVERLVGKPDAGLEQIHDVIVGRQLVCEYLVADDACDSRELKVADRGGEFFVSAHGVHRGQVGLNRLCTKGVGRVGVQEARVQRPGEFVTRGLLDDGAHVLLCLVV